MHFCLKLISFRCNCNLHGKFCVTNALNQRVCVCEHNTQGPNCELCKPLYNNKPWKRGSFTPHPKGTANACESKAIL